MIPLKIIEVANEAITGEETKEENLNFYKGREAWRKDLLKSKHIGPQAYRVGMLISYSVNPPSCRAMYSYNRITEDLSISESTAIRAIKELERAGAIKVIRDKKEAALNRPNQYALVRRVKR